MSDYQELEEKITKAANAFGKVFAHIIKDINNITKNISIALMDDRQRDVYLKKERNRKRYYRMMNRKRGNT